MAISAEVLADTNGIIALLDASDFNHAAAIGVANSYHLVVSSTVLPEVDYLVTKYLGEAVAQAFLQDLLDGYFRYLSVDLIDVQTALGIMSRYRDVPLGLVDSSVMALAERYKIQRILTFDRRHFSLVQPQTMEYFELLP